MTAPNPNRPETYNDPGAPAEEEPEVPEVPSTDDVVESEASEDESE